MLQSLVLNELHDVAVLTILSKGRLNNSNYPVTVYIHNSQLCFLPPLTPLMCLVSPCYYVTWQCRYRVCVTCNGNHIARL